MEVDVAVLDRVSPVPLTLSKIGRALLTAIAAVFVAIGWSASKVVRGVRLGLVGVGYAIGWSVAAMKVGYAAGRGGPA
jgi:hypothetical protein